MPNSNPENRRPVLDMLCRRVRDVDTVVDIGPGEGTYADLLRPMFPRARFFGVEKWAPYIRRFGLDAKYDEVIVADGAWLDWQRLGKGIELVIFGDVLEHMAEDEARWCWRQARANARWVLLSIPIRDHPQGEWGGNPYEEHVAQWDHQKVLDTFDGIEEWWVGDVVGVYLASRSDDPPMA